MRQLLFSLFLLSISFTITANSYTLIFKDGGTGSDKTTKLTSTSPLDYLKQGEDYVSAVTSNSCYLAKTGYGIKLGTANAQGSIVLDLYDTYQPTAIIITAAAFPHAKDSALDKGFNINGTSTLFTNGTHLTHYQFNFDGQQSINSLNIAANVTSNNRLYITQITIIAPDPAPLRGHINAPKQLNLGAEHLVQKKVETMAQLDITTDHLAQPITLSLSNQQQGFTLTSNTLPQDGGNLSITFNTTQTGNYSTNLILSSVGLDQQPVNKTIPLTIKVCSEIYHSGAADDPYTVQDALARIEELADNETSTQWWYIKGAIASDITTSQSTGGLTFDLQTNNNTLYVYALMGANQTTLNPNTLHLGDTILIYSRLQKYVSYNQAHNEAYMGYLVDEDIPTIDWRELQDGYYDNIQFTSDTTLKRILGETICGGIRYTYGSGTQHTWDAFYYTDRDQESMFVLDMYSNNERFFSPTNPTASVAGLDIEHIFPKSWWGGNVNDAYKDLYHLVPADYSANRSKGNDAPGVVVNTTFDNGSFKIGTPADNCPAPRVFEPDDEYKGDFARAYFYIITAYQYLTWDMTTPAQYALDPVSPLLLQPWLLQTLLNWHRNDPVSNKEILRIQEVARIQHNRNPYIDYPCLVEYIFGNRQGQILDLNNITPSTSKYFQDDTSGCSCSPQEDNTDPPSDIQMAASTKAANKNTQLIIINNNLYILHNNTIYTITGLPLNHVETSD